MNFKEKIMVKSLATIKNEVIAAYARNQGDLKPEQLGLILHGINESDDFKALCEFINTKLEQESNETEPNQTHLEALKRAKDITDLVERANSISKQWMQSTLNRGGKRHQPDPRLVS